jgi:hypothetical protein
MFYYIEVGLVPFYYIKIYYKFKVKTLQSRA